MLINPTNQSEMLQTFCGTRLLTHDFGLVGTILQDPKESQRVWTIQNLFKPLPRCLGGVRARCTDQKGFVSFIDQMSLEVLLGLAKAGDECVWADRTYPSPQDRDWFGFCSDPVDLVDDLYMQELLLRTEQTVLASGIEIALPVHLDFEQDAIDRHLLLWDGDRATGISPDARMETLQSRWAKTGREKVRWSHI